MRIRWHFGSMQFVGISEFPAKALDGTVHDGNTHVGAVRAKQIPLLPGIEIFILWLTFILVMMVVILLANLLAKPFDILAPYWAIMPGQPEDALAQFDCEPTMAPSEQVGTILYCDIKAQDPMFQQITVRISKSTIQQVTFLPTNLRYGDLLVWWGKPDSVEIHEKIYIATWGSQLHAIGYQGTWQSRVQIIGHQTGKLRSSSPITTFTISL